MTLARTSSALLPDDRLLMAVPILDYLSASARSADASERTQGIGAHWSAAEPGFSEVSSHDDDGSTCWYQQ